MFKIKLFAAITLLLFSASAAAGQYCVKLPEHWGNSKWSKRDNDIGVQFAIKYHIHDTVNVHNIETGKREDIPSRQPRDHFWREKKWRSSYRDGQQRDGYFKYCADMSQVVRDWRTGYSDSNGGENTLDTFRMSVIWGQDCPEVRWREHPYDVEFTVRRRKHNHVFPWTCS